MSSDPIQSALNGHDSCISPATNLQPDSEEYRKVEAMMQRVMQFMCDEFRNMNDRMSELKTEVAAMNEGKTMLALGSINERLSHFNDINARFNETGMLDQANIKALDIFDGRLLNIEEEIKFLKHSIQGTTDESNDSIKSYLGKIEERLIKLEGNLHRLEDRMFANLDGAIDDETGFITVVMDPVDFQKLNAMNPTEIAQRLRERGSGWKIESLKLRPPKTADQQSQVLINFLTRDSEQYMRQHISEMSELFGLEHGVFCLSPVYTMHVEHLVPHLGKNGMEHKDLEEALLKTLGVKDLKAKVTYDRMLLKTTSFDLVNRLCLTGVTIMGHYYQIIPFCIQGTPLFCYRCWKTGHFKEDCTASVMLCGRCSGAHDTRGCKASPRCCNCKGPHTTWSPECKTVMSMEEHRNSAWYRQLAPHWAKNLDKTGKPILPTVTKTKAQKASPAGSSPATSAEQGGASSSKAAEKRPVGRPKALPAKEPGQQTLGQFLKTPGNGSSPAPPNEPSSAPDADMTGTDTASPQPIQGTGSANSATPSSTADVTRPSGSDVDSSLEAMEIDIDTTCLSMSSENQSSGSDGDNSAANIDIDTASTADNEPVKGQTLQAEGSEVTGTSEAEGDPKAGKERNNNKSNKKNNNNRKKNNSKNNNKNKNNNNNKDNKNNKNNKNNNKNNNNNTSATNQKKTQTSNVPSSTPSSGSGSSQSQVSDKPRGASKRKRNYGFFKGYNAWKKAQKQAADATNDPPAPLSSAPDITPSNTPPDSDITSVPTPSAQTTSTPVALPPISTLSTPSSSALSSSTPPAASTLSTSIPPVANTPHTSIPSTTITQPATVPSTSSVPSVPIVTASNSLSSPPAVVDTAQVLDVNFNNISQPMPFPGNHDGPLGPPLPEMTPQAIPIPGKREGPLAQPPPEKRRKQSSSIDNEDGATDALKEVEMEEHASESQL
ncbi:hypothetical protein FNAPI_9496 [Fusarium napiforme]|uniref:CCHC-type domain-containing protein n=1 Tax=Fusarium napiforme TaxID=42672 RepID=A0A8H5J0K0_9HYPO|nr:hypothetical protein FNAPI_9496 [Fusarium napiforme]